MSETKKPDATEQPRANPDHGRGKKVDDQLPPTETEEDVRRDTTGAREGGKR